MEDEVLRALILKEFDVNKKRYGYRRVAQGLAKKGVKVCKHRVARLMNEMSLKTRACKKFKVTTDSHHKKPIAGDLINQNFAADRPDEKYVSDITYVRIWEVWLYLCSVLDLFSKMVVGWPFSRRLKATLVVNAINMAAGKGKSLKGRSASLSNQYLKPVFTSLSSLRYSITATECTLDSIILARLNSNS